MKSITVHRSTRLLATTAALAQLLALAAPCYASSASAETVDFRYSPPEWQSAICLPDDPCKSLVDKSGQLLYYYGQGGREFGVRIGVEASPGAVWKRQELFSPRVPIVRTFSSVTGLEIVQEAFAVTDLTDTANSGTAKRESQPRNDMILVTVTNNSSEAREVHPRLIINTTLPLQFLPEEQRAIVNGHEIVTASLEMTGLKWEDQARRAIELSGLRVPANGSAAFFVLYSGGGRIVIKPKTLDQALAARRHAITYWNHAPLPYGRVQVPDPGIQGLVDSAIRNIWQAREIKKGLPAFQVGPTCYRGLWIVDGAFILESAAILGAGHQARNGVAYELTYQKPDGRIEVMKNYSKENGIVLWTCVRHARLTQDKAWLESIWPKLERIAEYIKTLRRQTLHDGTPLDDGLVPPGFPDGGIGGIHAEYTNPYWNLAGLKAFIRGARWLGKTQEAAAWQKEYDDFMACFRRAAKRDMATDAYGNHYLPIIMGKEGRKELPQRGQWAFCHAVYPGQIFAKDDPLVAGNLAMLEATEKEGMVCGTGWDPAGIWNYFASFYAHAWLWQGNGRKAARILYAYANHAAPVLDWREEQSLKGAKFSKVGDMPHNWASAEFIRLTVHLIELDRGNELDLLQGFPPEWARPGMVTRLNGVETPFGPLHFEVEIAKDGKSARVKLARLAEQPARIVLHLDGLTGKPGTVELPTDRDIERSLPLRKRQPDPGSSQEEQWKHLLAAEAGLDEIQPPSADWRQDKPFVTMFCQRLGELADQFRQYQEHYPNGAHAFEAWENWMDLLNQAAYGIAARKAELERAEQQWLADPKTDSRHREVIRNNQFDRGVKDPEHWLRDVMREMPSPTDFFCRHMLDLAQSSDYPRSRRIVDKVLQYQVQSPEWYREHVPAGVNIPGYIVGEKQILRYYQQQARSLNAQLDRIGHPLLLKFTSLDGREVDLGRLRGKVVLLEFWATWCPPCVAGIPEIQAAWNDLHKKGFDVIALSYDTDRKRLERFVRNENLPWPQFFSPEGKNAALIRGFGQPGPPAYWLIDRGGILVDENADDHLEARIKRLLSTGSALERN